MSGEMATARTLRPGLRVGVDRLEEGGEVSYSNVPSRTTGAASGETARARGQDA